MLSRLGLIILFLFAFAPELPAHPHVFVENEVSFVFDGDGLAAIELCWLFDDMFGAGIIMDYDGNYDGKFSDSEMAKVKREAFDNLKNYSYFAWVRINGQPFDVNFVRDFKAVIRNGQLVYTFLIPCHVSALGTDKEVSIAVFDPEYYTQVDTGAFRVVGAGGYATALKKIRNPALAYYNRLIVPDEVILTFRSRP